MTKEFAQFLVEVTEHCGNQEIDLREGYSGRGMYGRETCSVVVNSPLQLITDMTEYIRTNLGDDDNGNFPWLGGEVPEPEVLRMDSMGRDSVVIY